MQTFLQKFEVQKGQTFQNNLLVYVDLQNCVLNTYKVSLNSMQLFFEKSRDCALKNDDCVCHVES